MKNTMMAAALLGAAGALNDPFAFRDMQRAAQRRYKPPVSRERKAALKLLSSNGGIPSKGRTGARMRQKLATKGMPR